MADGKRYYWLKLYDDFFGSIRIKKLRRMAGGDTYVIIYLKLQLKAMKTDGVLKWKGYEQDFVEELALDLDEEPDDVRVTLMYLLSCGLAETQDNVNFFFPYSVENVGSEGASAQRVREYRERQALQCNTDVTPMKQIGNGEIDTRDKIQEIDTRDRNKKGAGRADLSPLEKAMDDFTKHRKAMKKPLTDRARELILMDLERLAPNDPETQIAIINQSIKRGWQGVFPLKDDSPKPAAQKNGPPMKTQYDKTYAEPIDDDLDKLAAMLGVDV